MSRACIFLQQLLDAGLGSMVQHRGSAVQFIPISPCKSSVDIPSFRFRETEDPDLGFRSYGPYNCGSAVSRIKPGLLDSNWDSNSYFHFLWEHVIPSSKGRLGRKPFPRLGTASPAEHPFAGTEFSYDDIALCVDVVPLSP